MKATGIVRRIDDLGRVVIPKEIRRVMRIREGDPLEIFTDVGGEVVFKKYSPVGEMAGLASEYAEALSHGTSLTVIICDRDHCIAAAGGSKKDLLERRNTSALERIMDDRQPYEMRGEQLFALEGINRATCIAVPIVAEGDVSGCVALIESEGVAELTESDRKLARVAAAFLGNRMQ